MEIFNINITIDDIETNKHFREIMKKLLRVIKSMKNREHIKPTRRYIDLWYKSYGERHYKIIELYFKTKSNEVK
jgi:hypothetical protein